MPPADPDFAPALSRAEAGRRLREALASAGIAEAGPESRRLLQAALGLGAASLLAWPEEPLGPKGAARLARVAGRRLAREPVSRILGEREFWGLPFQLSPGTLDPRPDSETVVEQALTRVADRSGPLRLLDLGTGSGCLLVALLHALPRAEGIGIDRSLDALRTARANAGRNGVGARARFALSDWAAALDARFDLVVANPPYIPTAAVAMLEPEVVRHDPEAALDGGPDGLGCYRAILAGLPGLLRPGGAAVFEIGHDQAEAVARLAEAAGFRPGRPARDLGGRDRALVLAATP